MYVYTYSGYKKYLHTIVLVVVEYIKLRIISFYTYFITFFTYVIVQA